jgi:hypothetical protein
MAMYAGTPAFPSKNRFVIMSRYRPIAPKPLAPRPEAGTDPSGPQTSSSLSLEKGSSKKLTEAKGGRSRKRQTDYSSASTTRHAKKASVATAPDKGRKGTTTTNKASETARSKRNESGFPRNVKLEVPVVELTPILSDTVAPVFGPGGFQRFNESTVTKSSSECLRGNLMPLPYASASNGAESEVCSGEDVAESRRTDVVTLSLLPENPLHGPSSSPSESSFVSSSNAQKSKSSSLPSSSAHGLRIDCNDGGGGVINQVVVADTKLTMLSIGEEQQLEEEECRYPTRNKGLKNNNPKKFEDMPVVTDNFGPVAARGFVEQVMSESRTTHAPSYCPARSDTRQAPNGPVVDWYYLDQVYATSSDAVMLTDEHNRILWSNLAFQRAATEKTSGKMQSTGPHIDPLGIPTQLAVLTFQPRYSAAKCKAVLWGFLKKFIFQEVRPCFSDSKGLGELMFQAQLHEQSQDSRTVSFDASMALKHIVAYEGDLSLGLSPHKVIAPQPVQAVGSTIRLECITKVNQLASPITGTVEAFQDQLEKLLLPSVITDVTHKVCWVNTAYKQMVGQAECAWLSPRVGGNLELEVHLHNGLAGDVSIVFAGEQPPVDAAEFSCHVHVQWTKNGGKNSTSVIPTDVIRLDAGSSGPFFVWKFNIFNGWQPLGI